ncbi:hypothetical protein MBLNU459_g3293t2 [Dothideomycetes sp. NU459]
MSEYSEEENAGIVAKVKSTIFLPLRVATSKSAQRAYITSILFASTAFVLLFFAIAAYILFYWTYVPRIGFSRPIHLQFDPYNQTAHPWGVTTLVPDIVGLQGYDVAVHMRMPRTKQNTNVGNFMIDVALFAPGDKGTAAAMAADISRVPETAILAQSRRPAILTYYSPAVDLFRKASELHWYILGWRHEVEALEISVFEGVSFAKGWRNVPATLRIEMQSSERMQVYDVRVVFRARFRGLRWILYNYRIISAVVFTGAFWCTEMVTMALAWVALSLFIFPDKDKRVAVKKQEDGEGRIKDEEYTEDDTATLSDTERTFPTYGGQPPLKYSSPAIKKEESPTEPFPPIMGGEADDEDEDVDFLLDETGRRSDSGLGTSMDSSSGKKETIRKRKSRLSEGPS